MDFSSVKDLICPACGHRLYWNLKHTIVRCKSKQHKFFLTRAKYEEIVSGKTLNSFKKQRALDLR